MASTDNYKVGLQLNGYETIKSPLQGGGACFCCVCCDRTRPEYYTLQNGSVWVVTTDGTIGVLLPNSLEFDVKYHAKNYFSWRYSIAYDGEMLFHPEGGVHPPNHLDAQFNGSIMFPHSLDVIGFQTDVDQCVIFTDVGEKIYEGYYDGRRFPLLYNGEDNDFRRLSDFQYQTGAVHFPIMNEGLTEEEQKRWGENGKFRFTAERGAVAGQTTQDEEELDRLKKAIEILILERNRVIVELNGLYDQRDALDAVAQQDMLEKVNEEIGRVEGGLSENTQELAEAVTAYNEAINKFPTKPVLDKLGAGYAAVAWNTEFDPFRPMGKMCGYEADTGVHTRYSVSRRWTCKGGVGDTQGKSKEIANPVYVPIMPRTHVSEAICREEGDPGVAPQEVFNCQENEFKNLHHCATEFKPDTPLSEQIQGFDLSLCGNFVRVTFRNSAVQNNKWYRYVGNIESDRHLPRFLPHKFAVYDYPCVDPNDPNAKPETRNTLTDLLESLTKDRDGNPIPGETALKFDEVDDWGLPKWWNRFVQTFYVYGAHPNTRWQWMRFEDQTFGQMNGALAPLSDQPDRTVISRLNPSPRQDPDKGTKWSGMKVPGGDLDIERLQELWQLQQNPPPAGSDQGVIDAYEREIKRLEASFCLIGEPEKTLTRYKGGKNYYEGLFPDDVFRVNIPAHWQHALNDLTSIRIRINELLEQEFVDYTGLIAGLKTVITDTIDVAVEAGMFEGSIEIKLTELNDRVDGQINPNLQTLHDELKDARSIGESLINNIQTEITQCIEKHDFTDTYDPFNSPEIDYSFGLHNLDVISVGAENTPDIFKTWYYFNGYEWTQGAGTYQDLKNWSGEELGMVFYKGLVGINQCSGDARMIPASTSRLKCCGDFLLVGLNTDFESRMIYYKERLFPDEATGEIGLEDIPTPEQYRQESFACCDSFFGYTMLTSTKRVVTKLFDIDTDLSTGEMKLVQGISPWSRDFDVEEAPQFGECTKTCRYYFLRQSDKKGLYFYRPSLANTGLPNEEYGHWKFMKALDIKNEENAAPRAGCVSSNDTCFIPCEGANDEAGWQTYVEGERVSAQCHPLRGGYQCSPTNEDIRMGVGVNSEGCYTQNCKIYHAECDLWESYQIKDSLRPWQYFSQALTTYGYSAYTESSASILLRDSKTGRVLLDEKGNALRVAVWYDVEQCGDIIRMFNGRTRQQVAVKTIAVGDVDWKQLEPPDMDWAGSCGLATGGNSLAKGLGEWPRWFRGFTGGVEDARIAYYVYKQCSGSCCTSYNKKRLSGTIYYPNPYTGKLDAIDTGTAGTIVTGSDCYCGDVGFANRSVCFNGRRWLAIPLRTYPQADRWSLLRIEQDVVNEKMVYHTAKAAWEELNVSCQVVIGAGLPPPMWCSCVNYGNCEATITCANGSAVAYSEKKIDSETGKEYYVEGRVVVQLEHKNFLYSYTVSGYKGDMALDLHCCSAYSILWVDGTGHFWYKGVPRDFHPEPKGRFIGELSSDWKFSTCCGEAAIIQHEVTGRQRIFIDGHELSDDDVNKIFAGDPYHTATNDKSYTLKIKCCDDYYLFYVHEGNTVNWTKEYNPNAVKVSIKSATEGGGGVWNEDGKLPGEDPSEYESDRPFDHLTEGEAIEYWLENNNATMILLDGTPCHVIGARTQPNDGGNKETGGFVTIGPGKWRTGKKAKVINPITGQEEEQIVDGIARPAVYEWGDETNGKIKYPEVHEWEFDDPLAPWWNGGETRLNSRTGVVSLMQSLMGFERPNCSEPEREAAPKTRREMIERRIRHYVQERAQEHQRLRMNTAILNGLTCTGLNLPLPGLPGTYTPPLECYTKPAEIRGNRERIATYNRLIQGLLDEAFDAGESVIGQVGSLTELFVLNEDGKVKVEMVIDLTDVFAPEVEVTTYTRKPPSAYLDAELPDPDQEPTTGGTWGFGFSLEPGRNIAAAFYKTNFLYNDSRMQTVNCFGDDFGVFYLSAAGSYHWTVPFIERSHKFSAPAGTNAFGTPVEYIWESHFDMYMGIPNPLRQCDLEHERPPGTGNGTALGEWLQKYTPYGAYVFNYKKNGTQPMSGNFDKIQMQDDIEPPSPKERKQLTEITRPPYNEGWRGDTPLPPHAPHPYGDFIFFNDRNAPVRFDRALTWAKPFEDNCHHDDFEWHNSMDYLRSAFACGGNTLVTGGNGTLHIFDGTRGRMDFNAETLEPLEGI